MVHNCCPEKGKECCEGDCKICLNLQRICGCCEDRECNICAYCFGDCEDCCNIPPLNQDLNTRFKELWEVANRFGFKLEGRGCNPKEYFEKYPGCLTSRIFHIKTPFKTEGNTFYKVNFSVDIGEEYPKFIFVLVPTWFEKIVNNLKENETFLHRWFYFLYF